MPGLAPRRREAHSIALRFGNDPGMGFNRRKMHAERKAKADAEAVTKRAASVQVVEDAERVIAAWNERQARRMPMLFAPTIGAALACPAPFPMGLLPGLPHHAGH